MSVFISCAITFVAVAIPWVLYIREQHRRRRAVDRGDTWLIQYRYMRDLVAEYEAADEEDDS